MRKPPRGAVFANLGGRAESTALVVSRDARNRASRSVILAEIQPNASSALAELSSAVALAETDPIIGIVLTDYVWTEAQDLLDDATYLGVVGESTLASVAEALAVTFEL